MRGGLQRWKRGVASHGVRAAIAYALKGECDAAPRLSRGVEALAEYSAVADRTVTRYTVEVDAITEDELDADGLRAWVDGCDPATGERRGRELLSPQADLLLDGTINAPKSFSIVALIHPDLAAEFEALQDRLRTRIITTWRCELNARRGAGGRYRADIARLEVVELQHRRSRALDPHIHRHLWLNTKVQGADGKWSNVDSRVAMKLQTVINAEGELAARTDPQWIAALARHGYTIDSDGDISEVTHAVRPLSRRTNQIDANRAVLHAPWCDDHPGQQPDRDATNAIDRLAWAKDRPRKPRHLVEDEWESLVRDELSAIDPALLGDANGRRAATEMSVLDVDHLVEVALVDADARSVGTGSRFSAFDIRAGAMRAVAAAGVVAERDDLQPLIDEITARAARDVLDLLDDELDRPAHIKGFMWSRTAELKHEVAALFDSLDAPGADLTAEHVDMLSERSADGIFLDVSQRDAAGAVAGTHRLVTVTGPAGTGKTTLLRVARLGLEVQGRRMVVVAPTKKAASVTGREIGTPSSSLHALLADHGWRWGRDAAGAEIWTRLRVGENDGSGWLYRGPSRFPLTAGDRIVVDEAGMVDLLTARALATLATETGAGIAMIGDHLQAMPVGHSGAMASMARRSGSLVELSEVHRFHDPSYGELTLRLREPESLDEAGRVAAELERRGCIHPVGDRDQARDVMVEGYFRAAARGQRVALITATNEDADAINDAVQQRRIDRGDLTLARVAVGRGEQRILEGDVVQTRRNDTSARVENRALWTVQTITATRIVLASTTDNSDTRTVTADYVADHLQLAYAATVHGIQGETTDSAIVGPDVDASGLYVGMTRGRFHNEALALVKAGETSVGVIAERMLRGRPEVTVDDARAAARAELGRAARMTGAASIGARDELFAMAEWLMAARAHATVAESDVASSEANAHGRPEVVPRVDDAALDELRARIAFTEALLQRRVDVAMASAPRSDAAEAMRVTVQGHADPSGIAR